MNRQVITVLVVFLFFLCGCTSNNETNTNGNTDVTVTTQQSSDQTVSGGEIKIGVVASLTGGASATGQKMWESAVLASEEINAKGGVMVNGKPMKVVLVKGDDESSGEAGVKTVTRLITEDKVDVLVGGFSSAVTYANEVVAGEHKVPYNHWSILSGHNSQNRYRHYLFLPPLPDDRRLRRVDDVVCG
jgi:ABC-type branched-subunit amino acid transport system substrate-binding protein